MMETMPKKLVLLGLIVFVILGAVATAYLFLKEDIGNLGETLTGNKVEIPVEGEPTQETLLLSLFDSPIDFDGQMAKLRSEGFENNYFIAYLNKVDASKKLFTLKMEFPVDGGSEIEEKVATVNCPVESTAVLGQDNMELLAEKEDVFKWAKVNDLLVSYCLDSTCSIIGKECVLVKTSVQ